MSSSSFFKLALATSSAALVLSGCGSSDEASTGAGATTPVAQSTTPADASVSTTSDTQATPEASTAKVGAPEGRWAARLCSAMQGRVSAISPPQVDTSSPQATVRSLRTFFGNVVEEQGSQLRTLTEVGPPPGSDAERGWNKAVRQLRSVRSDLRKVERQLDDADVSSSADVQALTAQLGTQMQSLSSYGGPVAALVSDPAVGPALQRESTCKRFL